MKYDIFLDDCRTCYSDATVCQNYHDFVKTIEEKGLPNHISFDHDLGEEKDGGDCAQWLVNYCIKNKLNLPKYTIHSSNPVGKKEIVSIFETFEKYFRF